MKWSIGASTGCCVEHRILDVLGGVHAAGLRGVELGTPPNHFDPADRRAIRDVADRVHTLHLVPVSIHAPFGGGLELSAADPRERQAAIGRTAMAAAALRQLGGSLVVVHPTDVPRADTDVERRLDYTIESLNRLASICHAMSLRLAVETPLPHLIGGSPGEFEWILRQLDRAVVVCLDTSHATLAGNWDRFIAIAGDRVAHVHANDHRGQFDDHLPPGDGLIDWPHIASTLRAIGYTGWVMLEVKCAAHASHADHFARAYTQAATLLA